MEKSFGNQKGQVLIIMIAIIAALTVFGVSLLKLTDPELKISKRQIDSTKAFYIAEAGTERALHNIKENGGIGGFSSLTASPTEFGGGTYTISLVATLAGNEWTIKSVGSYEESTRAIQVDVKVEMISIWGNGVFGGSGASGKAINGNVDFRGSVHILGEELGDDGIALSMSGSAKIGNNYDGIASIFNGKYPALPTTTVNGIEVDTLNTTLRVKKGKVFLGGSAKVGDPNNDGNTYKETVDGVYVNGEITGTEKIFSDNGTENDYDLGNLNIKFPKLADAYTDPVTGVEYVTYKAYLEAEGSAFPINEISSAVGIFYYSGVSTNGKTNWISWNPTTMILEVHGVIIINSTTSTLTIGKNAGNTIFFKGKGTLVSLDPIKDIAIHSHLLSEGMFPYDALGFISAYDINIATGGEAQLRVMGAYYAEHKIKIAGQTQLLGSIVSNDFDMGSQVPKIFQVTTLADNLPPDMPGSVSIYYVTITNWHEVYD